MLAEADASGHITSQVCLIKNAHGNTAVVGNPCAANHRERQPSCWELPPLDTQQEPGGNPPDPSSTVIEVALGKAVGVSCFIEKKEEKGFVCMGANKLQQKTSQQQQHHFVLVTTQRLLVWLLTLWRRR